jgi:ATP-dependent RNA helicase MSS116
VATPGRLKDYLTEEETRAKLANIRTVILDEADTMLEQGFLQDVKHILRLLPPKSSGWQGMCFSATVPDKIKDVINVVLAPGYSRISTIDPSEPPTHARVPQYHVIIPSVRDTFGGLISLVQHEQAHSPSNSKIIVFGTTARLVALYAVLFRNIPSLSVYELHSRLSQPQRTRTTDEFKQAPSGIMLATDVIGRGMDFPDVTCVLQVGLPMNGEQYVHRVGRTARINKDGRAVILLTQAESFFLSVNRQLPVQPYAHTADICQDVGSAEKAAAILSSNIDEDTKQKAYSAYLGFMKGFMNKLKVKPEGLVAMANELAMQGMGCPEPPTMEKTTVGKMGLKGVKGIRYADPSKRAAHDEGQRRGRPPRLQQQRAELPTTGSGRLQKRGASETRNTANQNHKRGGGRNKGQAKRQAV